MKRHQWFKLSLIACLALGLGAPALADSPKPATTAETEAASAPLMMRGMQLFKDAETGELRAPTAKEAATLDAQFRKMFSNFQKTQPQVIQLKSGTTMIPVPNNLLKFSAARVEADGSLTMGCIQSPQRTLEFIETPSTNGPAER
ncbi:MAG: hypothetical protein AAF657_02970 [Acidobacteriota bacterium]